MGRKLSMGGTDNLAHKGKKMWIGNPQNKALKIKKAWIGDKNGIARLFFSSGKKAMIFSEYREVNSSHWTRKLITTDDVNKFETIDYPLVDNYMFWNGHYGDAISAFDKIFVAGNFTLYSSGSNINYTEDEGETWVDTGIISSGGGKFRMKMLNGKLCFLNQYGFNMMDSDLTVTQKTKYTVQSQETITDIAYLNGYYYYVGHYSTTTRLYRASENDTKFSAIPAGSSITSTGSLQAISLNVVGGLLVMIVDVSSGSSYYRIVTTYDGTTLVRQSRVSIPKHCGAGYVYMSDENTLHTIHTSTNKEVVRNTYVVQNGNFEQTESQVVITTLPFGALHYPVVGIYDEQMICLYRDVEFATVVSDSTAGNKPSLWCAVYEDGEWVTQKIQTLTVAESSTVPLRYTFFNNGEPNGYYYMPIWEGSIASS
jgi:hypothetical protein